MAIFLVATMVSCSTLGEPNNNERNDPKEVVVTSGTSNITECSATVYAYANPSEALSSTWKMGIVYSTEEDPSLNNGTTATSKELDSNNMYSVSLYNLSSETTYYYKAFVLDGEIYRYGKVKSFTTKGVSAIVETIAATDLSSLKATLNGKLTVNSSESLPVSVWFLYSSSPVSSLEDIENKGIKCSATLQKDGTFSSKPISLSPGAYYYVACASVNGQRFNGQLVPFAVEDFDVKVRTDNPSEVGLRTATLNGHLDVSNGESLSKSVWFLYSSSASTLSALKSSGAKASSSLSSDGTFAETVSYLSINTKYYYVACAKVNDREVFGEVKTFTTGDFSATVTTSATTNISFTSATLNGQLAVTNGEELSKSAWFLYSPSASTLADLKRFGKEIGKIYGTPHESGSFNGGSFDASLADLDFGTKYYYVACARVDDLEVFGEVRSFTTIDFSATASTSDATNITVASATLNGCLTTSNVELDKSVWFLYSSSVSTLTGLKNSGEKALSAISSNGSYKASINNLEYGTTYYYVACAKVNDREVFGEVKSFTTIDFKAKVSDSGATSITFTSVMLYGDLSTSNIKLDKSVWFIYGTTASTLADLRCYGETIPATLSSSGSFKASINNLDFGTTYYYVACAKVNDREVFGSVKSFTTAGPTNGEIIDMGLRVKWASCNLGANTPDAYGSYYAWGETTPKSIYEWSTYALCNGTDNRLTKYNNSSSYGPVVDNKITLELSDDVARINCGDKWRMPTEADFTELKDNCEWSYASKSGHGGYIVKASNGNCIFLPAAGYLNKSSYEVGSQGRYWSSSLYKGDPSRARYLSFGSDHIYTYRGPRCLGFSVRPVKE